MTACLEVTQHDDKPYLRIWGYTKLDGADDDDSVRASNRAMEVVQYVCGEHPNERRDYFNLGEPPPESIVRFRAWYPCRSKHGKPYYPRCGYEQVNTDADGKPLERLSFEFYQHIMALRDGVLHDIKQGATLDNALRHEQRARER